MQERSITGTRIQMFDTDITSVETHQIKGALDKDYKYLVGISISDVFCSDRAILESIRVKGKEVLPEGMEAIHLKASKSVAPNKRFFALFQSIEISGEDLEIKFRDNQMSEPYTLQVYVLLTNNPKGLYDVLYR